ncbi:MAG: hypothetical protein E5X60_30295 [Mesorhizobium sp.]|nr:MAG: hypothetical protein E5X60_30295 [Mesorhizobium sp.]
MVAEHVELALFEQSLGNIEGLNIIVMGKNGRLRCASVNGDTALLVAELAAWDASPLSEQASVDHSGTASILLAKLRISGHFGRP